MVHFSSHDEDGARRPPPLSSAEYSNGSDGHGHDTQGYYPASLPDEQDPSALAWSSSALYLLPTDMVDSPASEVIYGGDDGLPRAALDPLAPGVRYGTIGCECRSFSALREAMLPIWGLAR